MDKQNCKNTKAGLKFISLNINGYGGIGPYQAGNKWAKLNRVMGENKIGIAVVQETHMTESKRAETEQVFSRRMKIFASNHPTNPTAAGGVAVVLNRQLLITEDAISKELVEGRALLVKANWHQGEKLTILAIYAPNVTSTNGGDNAAFWKTLSDFFEQPGNRPWLPDIVAGDFNMVEDPIDRLPMRDDPETAANAFDNLKGELKMRDGWRETNPSSKEYTFSRSNSQSRLDRIYVTEKILQTARQWKITHTGIEGVDHEMVSVQITHEETPKIGKGRWSIQNRTLKNQNFKNFAKQQGMLVQAQLESMSERTDHENPQRILATYIQSIVKKAREIEKSNISTYQQEAARLQKRIQQIGMDTQIFESERATKLHELKTELRNMETKGLELRRKHSAAKDRLIGETICKEWVSANKEKKPRDIIYALEKPTQVSQVRDTEPPLLSRAEFEKHSQKMAELARDYHDSLQLKGLNHNPQDRQEAITEALEKISSKLTDRQTQMARDEIQWEEIEFALKHSKNGSSSGINGIVYEFWKARADTYKQDKRQEGLEAFDVITLLTAAYKDIQNHGIDQSTGFADGWICPIYKKGDRNQISNYRPITLLNTEYKSLTKALAVRL
ncbi:Endonuclease/exonuclease/phosphatase, partial [Lentinula lateritia]